jgi:hypothetical protein
MAAIKSKRRKSTRNRPTPGQVQSVRRVSEDTHRLYNELPEHSDQVLNAYVNLADWLRQFDAENPGVYADDPVPTETVARRW